MDITNLSIDEIGLSARSNHALQKRNIHTVGKMLDLTEEELINTPQLGRKSVDEILAAIRKYQELSNTQTDGGSAEKSQQNFDDWLISDQGKKAVMDFLEQSPHRIEELSTLSTRTYNTLLFNGYADIKEIVFLSCEDLMQIPHMSQEGANEILRKVKAYLEETKDILMPGMEEEPSEKLHDQNIDDLVRNIRYRPRILDFIRANDVDLEDMDLNIRGINCLHNSGYDCLSEIVFLSRNDLISIKSMGAGTADIILQKIDQYLKKNEERIRKFLDGNDTVLIDDDAIKSKILHLYDETPFGGYNFAEFKKALVLPEAVTDERLKHVIGSMLAEKTFEYVDFRCYRIYDRFKDVLAACPKVEQRNKEILEKRINGATLQQIADEYGLTRERIRQLSAKGVHIVKTWYTATTDKKWFDEDYFRYFYETYEIDKKDAAAYLGIEPYVFPYLDLTESKGGKKELRAALDDNAIETSLKLKIKTYLNRSKLLVDGVWIDKSRQDLEEVVVRKLCIEDTDYSDFGEIFNQFLMDEEIEYDPNLYFTKEIQKSRKNRLSEANFLLWKQSEKFRYYDIQRQDYSELYDTLQLDSYKDVELSTLKWMDDYPEIMEKYDIRDQYELHNLLRKTIESKKYPNVRFGKMPMISFGQFDRDEAILELLLDNSPITQADLADLIRQEYGYEQPTIIGTYLPPFSKYYHDGIYEFEQKVMPADRMKNLKEHLSEDFYYTEEVRGIYHRLYPEADLEEINRYNLMEMGFSIYTSYIIQNYPTADKYFESLFTTNEMTDLTPYRKKYTYSQIFSQKFMELKRNLTIVEYAHNQIILFKKLEELDVTKEKVADYCQQIYDMVPDETFFTIESVQNDGLPCDPFDLGFSETFYASLLLSDDRFSSGNAFGNTFFFKGEKRMMIGMFLTALIEENSSIDMLDLIQLLKSRYGFSKVDKDDVIYKTRGQGVYYDPFLDRLYANEDLYYQELEEFGR